MQVNKQTETTTTATAVASGIAYVKATRTSQEFLWLFGEQIVTLVNATEKDQATTIKTKIAKAIVQKLADGTEKPITLKTMQNKISNAISCYNKFADAKSANQWTMRELGGAKKVKKSNKFNAVEIAGKYTDLTSAQKKALIAALIAIS